MVEVVQLRTCTVYLKPKLVLRLATFVSSLDLFHFRRGKGKSPTFLPVVRISESVVDRNPAFQMDPFEVRMQFLAHLRRLNA
jgi:hypothetical protein